MPRVARTSPVLLCVVAIAIAIGAGASLVASAPRPAGTAVIGTTAYTLPDTVLGLCFVVPLAAGLAALIYRRIREGGLRFSGGSLAVAAVVFALLIAFALVGGYLHAGAGFLGWSPTSTSSGSTGGTPPNGSNNTTPAGGVGHPALSSFEISHGLILVMAAVVVLAVAGLLLPTMIARRTERRGPATRSPPRDAARTGAQAALARARSELDAGEDPRAVIERLYTGLLDRMVPLAGDLAPWTPEEIRSTKLLPLGVRPTAADALTRLFEEARYSTHPLGPEAAARVRVAVDAAAADLTRVPTAR